MRNSILKFRPIIFCELSPSGSLSAGSSILELFSYITENLYYNGRILLANNDFKEIDRDYINGLKNNINVYFFPEKKELENAR